MQPNSSLAALATLWLAGTSVFTPAWAQFKVVSPDGSVTYTDRPQAVVGARVTPLGRTGTPVAPDAGLPLELRRAMQRYPVTLYAATDCTPCDNARRYLQQRGTPFNERRISTEEDAAALERAVGGRSVPALTVGPQPLRGFAEADWSAYLDAAGYPRESRLPGNWQNPPPVAMVEKAPPPPRPALAPPPETLPAEAPAPPPGPRF